MDFLLEHSPSPDPFLGVPYEQKPPQDLKHASKNLTLEDMPIPDGVDDATFIDSFFEKTDETMKKPFVKEELFSFSQSNEEYETYYPHTPHSMGENYEQSNWFYDEIVDAGNMQPYSFRSELEYRSEEPYQERFKSDEEDDELEKAVIETARAYDRGVLTQNTIATQMTLPTIQNKKIAKTTGPARCPSYIQFPYSLMIGLALKNGGKDEEAVKSIYAFCNAFFKSYRMEDERWKKSLRHCISTCHLFQKGMRNVDCTGYYWKFSSNGLDIFNRKLAEFTQRHPFVESYGLWRTEDWKDIVRGTMGIPGALGTPPLETSTCKIAVKKPLKKMSPDEPMHPSKRILYPVKVIMQRPLKGNVLHKPPIVVRPYVAASQNFPSIRHAPYTKQIRITTTTNKISFTRREKSLAPPLEQTGTDTDVRPRTSPPDHIFSIKEEKPLIS